MTRYYFQNILQKIIHACIIFLSATGFSLNVHAQDKPLIWVGNIPIEPSFALQPKQGIYFDTPAMRITKIIARSDAENAEILEFYNINLPALGWQGSDGIYTKDAEQLVIQPLEMAKISETESLWVILLSPLK